jgi:tRNA dimethylallyltransferase
LPEIDNRWFLTGPTAAGKSAVGVELARLLGGEVISLDSMAIYRRMDIGTAKPTRAEQAAIPHHLIDVVEPQAAFSLADYVEAADKSVADILSRGRVPVFVGGTPLYLKALLRGIFQGPPADWEFREHTTADAQRQGNEWLHQQVQEIDPAAAARLHPQDTKRLVRVLEVFAKTGQPISELQRQFDQARPADECRVFVLDWPRDVLYRRINARVDAMFAAGLVSEVRGLLSTESKGRPTATGQASAPTSSTSGSASAADNSADPAEDPLPAIPGNESLSRTAGQALGYREVIEHLQGKYTLAETIELVKNRTRAFARRQLTWFRSLSECRWVTCHEGDTAAALAGQILREG